MEIPFVSILIDTFNHEKFIANAINSVLTQDFPSARREILVVDDGSTDRTREILEEFKPEIQVLAKSNGGQASAFNFGIPKCRGEIIAFLDGDDWWSPGKLSRIVAVMEANSNLGVLGHGIIQVSETGAQQIIALESETGFRLDSTAAAEFFRLNRCYFGTSRLTLRAKVARKVLPVPNALIFEADEYLFTLASVLADAIILPDPLTYYRLHGGNLFMSADSSREAVRRKHRVLGTLAVELRMALARYGATSDAATVVLEMLDLEATQLRLQLDGGLPWETFRTESDIYRIQHADAPQSSRIFRALSMIPALLLPPRWFYASRRWLGSQHWYSRARRNCIPFPQTVKPTQCTVSGHQEKR
jgi:hypothetical protein